MDPDYKNVPKSGTDQDGTIYFIDEDTITFEELLAGEVQDLDAELDKMEAEAKAEKLRQQEAAGRGTTD